MTGRDLVEFRERFNLTQGELAELLGYSSHSIVQRWELELNKTPEIVFIFVRNLMKLKTDDAKEIMRKVLGYKK